MKAGQVVRPTDHVVTNTQDPTGPLKRPTVYRGTGYGGAVQDASQWTLTRASTAVGRDVFSSTKVQTACCSLRPPASQVVNASGNADGVPVGLNLGYIVNECGTEFRPQSKSYFVDTLPAIQTHSVGILPASQWDGAKGTHYGTQLPLNCTTTSTKGAAKLASGLLVPKSERMYPLHSKRPDKLDFVTAPTGPQVSQTGQYGRAPKVGAARDRVPYVEAHHGRAWGPRPVPSRYRPVTGAPAQLKINDPKHYPVA